MYGSNSMRTLRNGGAAFLAGKLWMRVNGYQHKHGFHKVVYNRAHFPSTSPFSNGCLCGMLGSSRTIVLQPSNHASSSTAIAPSAEAQRVQAENREIIAKLLGVSEEDVTSIPMTKINEVKAVHTLDVLRQFGFTPFSIHLYPELLLMNGGAVENYIRIMQESGIHDVREVFILRFRTVCKQSLAVLSRKISLPPLSTIVERYCHELEVEEDFLKDFMVKLPKETDKVTLFELRSVMMGKYLGKLLLGSLDGTMDGFAKYPRLHYRSFNWIKRNYNILREFGFCNEKIKSHSYLLHTDPINLSKVMTIESLGGLEIKKICHLRPKILMSAYDTLLDIDKSLQEHGISEESIQKYPEVYTLSAATIRQRLEDIDTIPEFKLLKTHPRVARLIYYHNKAKSRLEDVRTMELRIPSLHILSSDTKRFNKSISTVDFRIRGVDIILFLADILQTDRKLIRESLIRHPHWLHVPLVNITSVLKFIQSVGSFSTSQLIDAVPLLLYPKEKVEEEMDNVIKSGDGKLEDKFFLQMVLYYLERSCHFTGDAVWPEKVNRQEFEDEEGETILKPTD